MQWPAGWVIKQLNDAEWPASQSCFERVDSQMQPELHHILNRARKARVERTVGAAI